VIAHRDEEVEEQFATLLHLDLHGATSLEGVSAADDESEVMGPKLRVSVRCIRVGESGGREDGSDLDARLEALLAEGEALEFVQAVVVGGTAGGC
jgi:hypothetical protein